MANYIDGDEFLYDALNDSLTLELLPEYEVQTSFHNNNVDDIEMLSETTSMSFSDSEFAKPRSRPKWYDEFFQTVSEKRHKCRQCGWIGMAAKHSLSNLIAIFNLKSPRDVEQNMRSGRKKEINYNLNFHPWSRGNFI